MRFPIKITENFLLEPVMHAFGAKPEVSYAELGGGKLEVQMGTWFHETLPLDQVASVAPSDWPWWGGLGVKLHHHGVGVVASTDGIVNVKLKEPRKVKVGLGVTSLPVECGQLWLSIEDRDGFLKAVSEACGIAVSPHTPF